MASIPTRTFTDRTGQEFVIRTAQPDDAAAVLTYIRPVAEDTEFFVLTPDEFPTEEAERTWIQGYVDHPGKILLLAEAEGTIIGNVNFEVGPHQRISHRGNLGIAVVKQWRGRGVGTALLLVLLEWADSNPVIEKVCLDVFATNDTAIRLYRKLGFDEEGRRIKDVKRGPDHYVDTVTMCQFVNERTAQ
jgi:RimJ/RimL family protein N-acetyltransferase